MIEPRSSLLPVAQTPPQLYCQLIDAGIDAASLPSLRDACLMVTSRTRHLLRGSGKPFSCHLIGVASLVAEATGDFELTLTGLLHAISQQRLSGGEQPNASGGLAGAERVVRLVKNYAVAGDLLPDDMPADLSDRDACDVRILQLADHLEDAIDGGPWWHGRPDDIGVEPGGAIERVARMRAMCQQFALAPALGAPLLLARFNTILADWEKMDWPSELRSGWYSSHAPQETSVP